MDIELILYIIFIVIAILTRVLKSSKDTAAPPSPPQQSEDQPRQRPQRRQTFEDLLREFTGEEEEAEEQYQERPATYTRERHQERPASYYDEQDMEEGQEADDNEIKETYQRSVNEAKKLKTLDEQVDLNKPIPKRFKDSEVEEENETTQDILEMLRDAEGAKKAIILSDIINKKY